MPCPKLQIKVINKKWTVRYLKARRFIKLHEDADCLAITDTEKKRIDLRLDKVTYETVAHELTHAYLDELCIGDAVCLKKWQMEEAICEIMAKFGTTIVRQTIEILASYRKLKERKK